MRFLRRFSSSSSFEKIKNTNEWMKRHLKVQKLTIILKRPKNTRLYTRFYVRRYLRDFDEINTYLIENLFSFEKIMRNLKYVCLKIWESRLWTSRTSGCYMREAIWDSIDEVKKILRNLKLHKIKIYCNKCKIK